jgi:hypothetical protein
VALRQNQPNFIFWKSQPTLFPFPSRRGLVSVAALLRRYSPSPHPLLRLLSHVPALAYSNQLYLPCKSCQLYTTLFRGTKSAPREPKQDPPRPKITSFSFKAEFFSQHGVAVVYSTISISSPPSCTFALSYPSSIRHCLSTLPPATLNLLTHSHFSYSKETSWYNYPCYLLLSIILLRY